MTTAESSTLTAQLPNTRRRSRNKRTRQELLLRIIRVDRCSLDTHMTTRHRAALTMADLRQNYGAALYGVFSQLSHPTSHLITQFSYPSCPSPHCTSSPGSASHSRIPSNCDNYYRIHPSFLPLFFGPVPPSIRSRPCVCDHSVPCLLVGKQQSSELHPRQIFREQEKKDATKEGRQGGEGSPG